MSWQRANIQAAADYLREKMAASGSDVRAKAVYEGLLDVLEPTRRATRMQREMALSAKAAVAVQAERDRREKDRRTGHDRRVKTLGAPGGVERRRVSDRRTDADRRHGRR